MKKLSKLADVGAKCIARVAALSASAACGMYYYQPKTPANVARRLKKR
jgi:cyclic lactone autoinducer peptide